MHVACVKDINGPQVDFCRVKMEAGPWERATVVLCFLTITPPSQGRGIGTPVPYLKIKGRVSVVSSREHDMCPCSWWMSGLLSHSSERP